MLDRMAAALDRRWITPDRLTGLNLLLGLASAGLAAAQWWIPALAAWLCRAADGLDAPWLASGGTGQRRAPDCGRLPSVELIPRPARVIRRIMASPLTAVRLSGDRRRSRTSRIAAFQTPSEYVG